MKHILTATILSLTLTTPAFAVERSYCAKAVFAKRHPCPANGKPVMSCPGFVIDHIKPLACGGLDDPDNMQWQTTAEGLAKDKVERIGCGK